jgi:hypothetical protein
MDQQLMWLFQSFKRIWVRQKHGRLVRHDYPNFVDAFVSLKILLDVEGLDFGG